MRKERKELLGILHDNFLKGDDGIFYRVSSEEETKFELSRGREKEVIISKIIEKIDRERRNGLRVSFSAPMKKRGRWHWAYDIQLLEGGEK